MKKLPNRLLLLFLGTLFLSVSCLAGGQRERRSADLAEPTPIPTAVTAARPTYEVARGTVTFTLDFTGRVVPVVEEPLFFPRDGLVANVYLDSGDRVQAGDVIADLDNTALEAELVLAQSALAVAEGQLTLSQQQIEQARQAAELARDLSQLDLDFAVQEAGSNPTAEEQYQIDRLTLLVAMAQLEVDALDSTLDPELQSAVDEAALRVAELESQMARSQLLAPFDGEISSLNLAPGRSVAAFEPVGVLADPSQIEISANLPEAQMRELAEGMTVEIEPAGAPGEPLAGTITRLPAPFGSGGGEEDDTRLQFDDATAAFNRYEPGDRVRITTIVTERTDVLWLPPAAIRDFNGRKFVVVQTDGVEQRVDVSLGIEGNGRVEIVDGLNEGQIIVGQ
ncbi:MAG: HlyD family efflux transporter periplasmic adaptor subunit [Anaerolineaceae bacterium]|nr:HlyD family efflux transporter periplasmic adaptor subunit [Anaerolineaceae bacterium]